MNDITPLRIAQVIDVFENASNGAGISTQRFTGLLRKHGHKVTILSTGKAVEGKVVLKEFYPPLPYIRDIMQRMKFVFAWPDKKIIRQTLEHADIVHNQLPLLLGIAAVRMANRLNKPVVSTFHVQGEQLMHNGGLTHPFWTRLAYWIFITFIYNRSDMVICPSEFAEKEIKRYGLKKPTVVISNGCTPEYHPIPVTKKYPDKFTILTVGRNAGEKRQEVLIRAVAASPFRHHIQLIILGDGPLRNHLIGLSQALLDGRAEFLLLPAEQVIEYYNMADLYVHTAAIEVECMTAIEAMSCGLPLLIADSELSATKQFALNEKHLFRQTEELTERINYWFTHKEELAAAGKEYLIFSQRYSIDKSYEKLIQAYYKTIEIHEERQHPAVPDILKN